MNGEANESTPFIVVDEISGEWAERDKRGLYFVIAFVGKRWKCYFKHAEQIEETEVMGEKT